ncbi:Bromodomain-containing protein 8 [Lobosporangium transversale]|uniref:Bromo domain-containing protein n=1 Tax=Lobosporangium transversale TaxID=64571 RepID=A0A1Y2G7Q2_9FUNG|nr:hypothetical protein BCR41DRAFT_329528 [Lobosporangium transversale]KAF9918589.1 Bromodomain-containing protein 8 [Lobosporangium transversale]ORY96982.1 hypothetical protein BCR41DRAFT_329528 [Lobosporangium transversale]|eukprot:XP_021875544.1 hypothetical protein BCR41DRAFT_329528 [Lobosporangium transversale]
MADPTSTDVKSDSEPWSVLENLILAQAIYKCGGTDWVAIARTIKGHPQVHRSNNFFSQKSCATQYTHLLKNLEAETRSKQSRGEAGSSASQDIPSVVKLAGQLYNQRILEIKALIRKDEERFRALVTELEEIRQGKWDSQLAEELKKNPPPLISENEAPTNNSDTSITANTDDSHSQLHQEGDGNNATTSSSDINTIEPFALTSSSEAPLPQSALNSEQVTILSNEDEISLKATPTTIQSEEISQLEEDVNMEDVAGSQQTPQDASIEFSNSISSSAAPTLVQGTVDIEMSDATEQEPLKSDAIPENNAMPKIAEMHYGKPDTVSALKDRQHLNESLGSESDLLQSGAIHEEIDIAPSGGEQAPETNTQLKNEAIDEEANVEKQGKRKDDEMMTESEIKDKEETEEDSKKASSREKTPELHENTEETLKKEEELNLKPLLVGSEKINEAEHSLSHDHDHDGEDTGHEGATSGDEDVAGSTTKAARKPKKIKTSTVPGKRRRRSTRGTANAVDINEDGGYNSTDSEATDGVNTNISSDHVIRPQMDDKKWKKILMMIWSDIANHRFGAVFMQPIKEQDAPGYYYMIKRPMDLKSIKERIRDGQITNADEFHRDVLLMFMNAIMYNNEDTEVYHMAQAMMSEVEFIIKNFKSSQSFAPIGTSGGLAQIGSSSTSTSTTPTTRTAGLDLLSGSSQPMTRKRKSSGLEMTPVE